MIELEPLTGHHDRSAFSCGVEALDTWLKRTALQHQGKGILRTFVAVPVAGDDASAREIFGFYALASTFVLTDDLPSTLARRYPRQIPATRLGRLAVRHDLQGQGLGRLLLADAVHRARGAAQAVGSAGLFVDAKDAAAASFYAGYGFVACFETPLKLYLPFW